jgi:hypothetical protein
MPEPGARPPALTNRGLAVLGLRLLALLVAVLWLLRLPEGYFALASADYAPALLIVLALPPLLAVLLWAQVGRLVELVLPQRTAEGTAERAEPGEWQAVAFAAVGVLVLVEALPALVRVGLSVYLQWQPLDGPEAVSSALWVELGAAMLRLVLAISLVFGSRGLARWVVQLRRAGVSKAG